ncbi:unnamed protein product [Notodromas monacha]|uniref:JmjC domain-containing protein n=1 Tax=Notodromas monacha TaxID=399045 RepID=A0A7R9GB22_9CRUS|nr:unnamed protein product [Notodromas monacha]CAG0914585.1 unnamed protein product [Notodromas monacha]
MADVMNSFRLVINKLDVSLVEKLVGNMDRLSSPMGAKSFEEIDLGHTKEETREKPEPTDTMMEVDQDSFDESDPEKKDATIEDIMSEVHRALEDLTSTQEYLKTLNILDEFMRVGKCQSGHCTAIPLCRECVNETYSSQQKKDVCRFRNFRVISRGNFTGFLSPFTDVIEKDLEVWLPVKSEFTRETSVETAKYILSQCGDTFCSVVKKELEVFDCYKRVKGSDATVFKRMTESMRELCDCCATAVFNYHFACSECGFAVCLNCWMEALTDARTLPKPWVPCGDLGPHEPGGLLIVQNIPARILEDMNLVMHLIRRVWGIDANCGCDLQQRFASHKDVGYLRNEEPQAANQEILRSLGIYHAAKVLSQPPEASKQSRKHRTWVLENERHLDPGCTLLCGGDMVSLPCEMEDKAKKMRLFQEEWQRGQPVMVTGVLKFMKEDMWTPHSFNKEFGTQHVDLINSITGDVWNNQFMNVFWDGFMDYRKRPVDSANKPMQLKLKDWPPGEDFKSALPAWYDDVMAAFPLGDYTNRVGKLNMAHYLPNLFLPPDLGPKMYVAYGSALLPTISSTNLHLDVSDAANVMVYVGACSDEDSDLLRANDAAIRAVCDPTILHDIQKAGRRPGALWHIYEARDAEKIRDMLRKDMASRNVKDAMTCDPIHDQSTYMDHEMRRRLREEYGVKGYAFVQCLGDAVFIPAGAPHQVRNLMNCVKVAEDFVSPETLFQCLDLMRDFRRLTGDHSSHEDKIQVKNMLYHAVKCSIYAYWKSLS